MMFDIWIANSFCLILAAMRKSVERVKAGELEKRKKVWEEKEERERPSKRSKKVGDEKGTRFCNLPDSAPCRFPRIFVELPIPFSHLPHSSLFAD